MKLLIEILQRQNGAYEIPGQILSAKRFTPPIALRLFGFKLHLCSIATKVGDYDRIFVVSRGPLARGDVVPYLKLSRPDYWLVRAPAPVPAPEGADSCP